MHGCKHIQATADGEVVDHDEGGEAHVVLGGNHVSRQPYISEWITNIVDEPDMSN